MFDAPVGRLILVICAAMRSARKRALSLTPIIGKLRRMNRIVERFGQLKKKEQKGFIVYIGAGDPNLETTRQLALAFDLAGVDVLCSHLPPAFPELTYDVVARRFERGSAATLAAIRAHQPRLALFGHVHQPLAARMRIGRTECVNVGHFRGTGVPYVLDW